MSCVYDTVCCTMYSCTMYDQRSVAYTNKNILFVSHVVNKSRTIRIIHEYTERHLRYGGYNNIVCIVSLLPGSTSVISLLPICHMWPHFTGFLSWLHIIALEDPSVGCVYWIKYV